MITDQDISKLKKVFATKEDFADLSIEVGELHDKFNKLELQIDDKLDTLLSKVDMFVGSVNEVRENDAAGAAMLYRHERQIQFIADTSGITLLEE